MKNKTIIVLTKAAYLSYHSPPTSLPTWCTLFVHAQKLMSSLHTQKQAGEQSKTVSHQFNGL